MSVGQKAAGGMPMPDGGDQDVGGGEPHDPPERGDEKREYAPREHLCIVASANVAQVVTGGAPFSSESDAVGA